MNLEPQELEIIELIKQKQTQKAELGENWLVINCVKQIEAMRRDITMLEELIRLSKNPEVMQAINLFVGKR